MRTRVGDIADLLRRPRSTFVVRRCCGWFGSQSLRRSSSCRGRCVVKFGINTVRAPVLTDSTDATVTPWIPQTTADREAVREQLGRILSTALFRNSKRFPAFLQHTVEHALTSGEPLKERTIGHEVFAREPGYDTGQDPVVRMTAAEVRKRLTQYYQQPEHQAELIVAFQPGSYVPEFLQPATTVGTPTVDVRVTDIPSPALPPPRR